MRESATHVGRKATRRHVDRILPSVPLKSNDLVACALDAGAGPGEVAGDEYSVAGANGGLCRSQIWGTEEPALGDQVTKKHDLNPHGDGGRGAADAD